MAVFFWSIYCKTISNREDVPVTYLCVRESPQQTHCVPFANRNRRQSLHCLRISPRLDVVRQHIHRSPSPRLKVLTTGPKWFWRPQGSSPSKPFPLERQQQQPRNWALVIPLTKSSRLTRLYRFVASSLSISHYIVLSFNLTKLFTFIYLSIYLSSNQL